jgi:hypothetical protein
MTDLTVYIALVVAAGLLGGIFGALAGARTGRMSADGLRARLEDAEASNAARELRSQELADQVERHLKRVQAIRQHRGDSGDVMTDELLRRKLSIRGGE